METTEFNELFDEAIRKYHSSQADKAEADCPNPYPSTSLEFLLYAKNWIDSIQWHLEDLIRDPEINPSDALGIKRKIDAYNQKRTDTVEYIDAWYLDRFKDVKPESDAGTNTETPAWAIDRLSILAQKIHHMREETLRQDATPAHIEKCSAKLSTLLQQREDLTEAIGVLLEELGTGKKKMKLYKQMKMYNDADTNPILYGKKQ